MNLITGPGQGRTIAVPSLIQGLVCMLWGKPWLEPV